MSDQSVSRDRENGGKRPSRDTLAASVARRFHLQGHTKMEIAAEFGISRFKVARLLDAAREAGIVRIEIAVPDPVDVALSDQLRSRYGLRSALVLADNAVPAGELELRSNIADLAARLLGEVLASGDVLGLAWSRTVNVMADLVTSLPRCSVVQMCGVYSRMDMRDNSVETVRRVAASCGGRPYPIYAPLVLPDRRTAETLRRQPGIAEAFERFDRLDKAVVAIGAWRAGQSTVHDVLDAGERAAIGRLGARAEMSAHLFDGGGRLLTTGLSHHVLGISAEQLRAVPEVIGLGGGIEKAQALDAVLRSGLLTTVVTDAAAATEALRLAAESPPQHASRDRAVPA